MEFGPFLTFAGGRQLKDAVVHLASLEESEVRAVVDGLSQLDAPIDDRQIKASSKRIHERVLRLSEEEWENVLGVLLQTLSVRDFAAFIDDLETIDDKMRAKVKKTIEFVGSNELLKKVIATDRLLDRGPRLRHMSWFCDVRTQFTASDEARATKGSSVPQEEIRLPLVIIRLNIDEIREPVYFQLAASELEDHISALQKARDQLRYLAEKERK